MKQILPEPYKSAIPLNNFYFLLHKKTYKYNIQALEGLQYTLN